MEAYRFELPPDKGPRRCDIRSITIRETTGTDEAFAAQLAEAKGKQGSVHIETVRASIVAVDDKLVSQPFVEMDKWNTRTRTLVSRYFASINGTDDGEIDPFVEKAQPVQGASRPALSAVVGSGEGG